MKEYKKPGPKPIDGNKSDRILLPVTPQFKEALTVLSNTLESSTSEIIRKSVEEKYEVFLREYKKDKEKDGN